MDSLPEELPTLPGFAPLPFSPKEMRKQWKEFEERSKEYFMDQADSLAVYYIESQEQARDMAKSAGEKTAAKEAGAKPKTKSKSASSKRKDAKVKTVRAKTVKKAPKTKA